MYEKDCNRSPCGNYAMLYSSRGQCRRSSGLYITDKEIVDEINKEFSSNYKTVEEAVAFIKEKRLQRFNELIDTKFSTDTLIELLTDFEQRNDEKIKEVVTDNADVPTIFEYIIGIIWYKISQRQGNILDFMNLSLDANLLPKTHAGGLQSDIVYQYAKTASYPQHNLLIEVTLMNMAAQKHNEDEPVTRHLGEHRLLNHSDKDYCTFIASDIPTNLISSFRNKRTYKYFDKDSRDYVSDFKIIPLKTKELKTILHKNMTYEQLYPILDTAQASNEMENVWYDKCIVSQIA